MTHQHAEASRQVVAGDRDRAVQAAPETEV
jgi:hypothetical protein